MDPMKDAPEFLWFAIGAGIIGLIAAAITAIGVLRKDQGSGEVREIGNLIKEGANAFIKREYLILSVFVIIVAVIIGVFVDFNLLDKPKIDELNATARTAGVDAKGPWTAIAYLLGAIGSGLAGYIGMSIAVRANTRTATAAQDGLNPALRVAFGSGTVMGLTVTGIGLLGIVILWSIFKDPNIVAGFAFGASSIALFARVGGGIYTKAADVGADLFESYVGAMIASLALAAVGAGFFKLEEGGFDSALLVLPMAIAGIGIIASIIGTFLVRTGPDATMGRLLWSLRTGIFGAGILALAATALVIIRLELPFELFWVVVTGLVVGQVIGTATEYFTSYENKPTQWIAKQSETGAGSVVIAGIAMGLLSTVIPAFAIVSGILIADELAGLYGVALAAVGMLSTLGITLATDAYGPVADNAGGIAEQGHLDPEVRERTDALDALGNTTAATGKGFAIGSAVLTALALMVVYVTVTGIDPKDLSIIEPEVLAGMIIGGMLPFLFAALTMQAVGTAANAMIVEVRRQFREIPGLREGKEGVKPDAARAVDISTRGALKAMFLPGLIAVVSPILVGYLVSAEALGGLLIGSIVSGFLLAIFMANAGGAWDNAKKYVELGHHGGKGTDAHAAAVAGDTVGDPFKDTSGPAINILLKLMAVVSVIFGPLFI